MSGGNPLENELNTYRTIQKEIGKVQNQISTAQTQILENEMVLKVRRDARCAHRVLARVGSAPPAGAPTHRHDARSTRLSLAAKLAAPVIATCAPTPSPPACARRSSSCWRRTRRSSSSLARCL